MTTTYHAPTVNLNGTLGNDLLDQQRLVIDACDTLLKAMALATPHGRDYQTQDDPGANTVQAREEHFARVKKIEDVKHAATKIAKAIYFQVN